MNSDPSFPNSITISLGRPEPITYDRCPSWALIGLKPIPLPPGATSSLEEGDIALFDQHGPALAAAAVCGQALTPLYAQVPDGPPSVPTGKIFVRFPESESANTRRQAFEDLGYTIDSISETAPHAAWLSPSNGEIAAALNHLPQLETVPDLVWIEPQLLPTR